MNRNHNFKFNNFFILIKFHSIFKFLWYEKFFLFFILSSLSSIPRPFFNDTSSNFEIKNKWIFWMILQLGLLIVFFNRFELLENEQRSFLKTIVLIKLICNRFLYNFQTYSEGSKVTILSPHFVFYFAVAVTHLACVSCCSIHFPWYFLGGREGGGGTCYTFSGFFYFE